MERLKKRKLSFTKMIIIGIVLLGFCMITVSLIMLIILQIIGKKGAFSSELFVKMEYLIAITYIVVMIALVCGASYKVANRIRKKGKALLVVVDKIGKQQLDFEVEPTGIIEIDKVLVALTDMKDALSHSLTTQWEIEQNKQKQLAALVHDLKTPITILEGNLYLLELENLSTDGSKSLEDMNACVKEMEYYMKTLLEMNRECEKPSALLEVCQMKALVEDILNTTAILFHEKNIELQIQGMMVEGAIFCDSYEMKRAIQNIVTNAIDFSPPNSLINITMEDHNTSIELCIVDSGKGFSEEDLKRAKEAFYMSDLSRGRIKHYGLGLYIAENIVKKYGGRLQLFNKCQEGGGVVRIIIPKYQ